MDKYAVIGLEKNNVWDFYNTLKKVGYKNTEFIPFIYSHKEVNLYDRLEEKGFKPENFAGAISVGGDGTFLYASRVFAGTEVPIFGVNKGHLGFNNSIEENEFNNVFERHLAGKSSFYYKSLLDIKVGTDKNNYNVVNDGVISYTGISRVIRLKVFVENSAICDFRGDGLIVSSPTGSTAYNLSAGGPILHPSVNAFVLCPICPHTLNIRPYIVPYDETIFVKVEESSSKTQLTLDGQKTISLETGEEISFKRSEKKIKIIEGSKNFSEILKMKLGWMV
jgi:NAD+ kinase